MLRKFLILLFGLLLAGVLTIWLLLQGSLPTYEGEITVPGLLSTVTAERDTLGTVTLHGENRMDLARGLGFIHAQERFFEMDLLRRAAAGELAELFGTKALPVDREIRPHRLRARAQAMLNDLPENQKLLLQAYRDGVNTGLAALQTRPFTYLLTQTQPQEWRAEDCLLVVFAMYFTLQKNSIERELGLSRMHAALPETAYRFLTAGGGEWDASLDGVKFEWPAYPTADDINLRIPTPQRDDSTSDITQAESVTLGSNAFAVAGSLANGSALVANDMHLALRVPGLWFRTRLIYPNSQYSNQMVDINGVSLPGTPAIVVGSNRHIAWAFTNVYGDFADWVRIRLDPDNPDRYFDHDQWRSMELHEETLHVRGADDEILQVQETVWGPVLAHDDDATPLVLAWAAHRPGAVNFELLLLEQTDNIESAINIAQNTGIPAQNFIVGHKNGDIAWTIVGRIPQRVGDYDAQLPADWGSYPIGWNGWLPTAAYPTIINPKGQRLWSGNARMVSGSLLEELGDGGYELGARSGQIHEQLLAREHFSPTDFLAIQLDDRAVLLTRWKQLLDKTLQATTTQSSTWVSILRTAMQDWDGHASSTSVAYRVVHDFRSIVTEKTLDGFVTFIRRDFPDFTMPRLNQIEHAVWRLLEQRPLHLLSPNYSSWDDLLASSAEQIAEQLKTPSGDMTVHSWGQQNTAHIRHPLSQVLPAWLTAWLDMPADPLPGDHHMPRVQTPDFGASLRFVVAPGQEEQGIFQMPGGQSGHPLSPYYGSGHADWVNGTPTPFLPGPTQQTLLLLPAEANTH